MFPIHDNIPPRTTPVVNYVLIGLTTLAFLGQLSRGEQGVSVERLGMIPARVLDPAREIMVRKVQPVRTPFGIQLQEFQRPAVPSAVPPWLTLLTCIFLHGGWMHFLGNMWFLHIFGDNVEDRLGHVGYLLFYLGAGVVASFAHLVTNAGSEVPTIGASGAIAGVMGAYLCLYPKAKVLAVIPIFILLYTVVLPAPVFLGVWFVMQFFQGVASISSTQSAGVAWWAHIGGFVAGVAVAKLLDRCHVVRPQVTAVRPHSDRVTHYRAYPRR